ncbi:hypothetical protein [uncultured Carboxylicivirga sp.]|nr:hypothetical protein [uncultured Carboxylicivirga sp.]
MVIEEEIEEPEGPVPAQQKIVIDVSKRLHAVPQKPGGVVSCWLMDSDIERPRQTSFSDAMKDMGVKYIRFPYGHLADNYLWDADGDWGNTLTPKVATFAQAPAKWEWAVDQTSGEFIKDMDFDEYISICNNVGAEPMVVVNILSYKYKNGPSYEQLKESAVEWVRYANITKGYGVKRWALGNEVDHHSDLLSKEEYMALYSDFASAMKEVDAEIMVGPGLLGNWHAALVSHDPDNIDFICAHNYLYKYDWRNQDYAGWKQASDIMVNHVETAQNAVNNSSIPDIEIHVTEMNSRPWSDKSDNDDLFRALAYGEMLLNATTFEDVKATYVWNTHGPWGGENENTPYNVLDLDNNREPRGDIIKLINENLLEHFVEVPRVKGYLRAYASVDESNENLRLILMNKNDEEETVNISTRFADLPSNYTMISYTGNGPLDEAPVLSDATNIDITDGVMNVELAPVSFNVITLKLK